jgi:endo-1,4-beta-xylanase
MLQRVLLSLYFCLLYSANVWAQNPIGLRAVSFLRGFLLGAESTVNCLRQDVDNGEYSQKIKDNYQLMVIGNELKPMTIWKGENRYNFTDPDFILGATPNSTGWAQQNMMKIRGHNLVWAKDRYTPGWLLKQEASITPEKAKQLLSDYIHTVVGRYRGKILWWDVVNEAIDDSNNTNPLNIRDSFWFRKMGPDFIKYAFMFAQEADPSVQLYYNEYGLELFDLKTTWTINLVNWLRSQDVTVHGVGLQWHISVSKTITPGDRHYQAAQHLIDNKLDIMVTELDVAVPTNGGYPVNPQDLQTQGDVYRSMLNYALHFSPSCKAMLTWGFTDRYSWIPPTSNYTSGAALPLDWMYLPKPAYWQMQEVMARVVDDGVYRLSPQSQPDKCLGTSQNTTSSDVELYSGDCHNTYQKWNITWQGDGTYRFSSEVNNSRVLAAYNTTASVGGIEIYNWSGDVNQEWAFSVKGTNIYRIVPRTAWWRVMTVYGSSDAIGIIDLVDTSLQNWILTKA